MFRQKVIDVIKCELKSKRQTLGVKTLLSSSPIIGGAITREVSELEPPFGTHIIILRK